MRINEMKMKLNALLDIMHITIFKGYSKENIFLCKSEKNLHDLFITLKYSKRLSVYTFFKTFHSACSICMFYKI
jgi:hypothetical protein